LRCMADCSGSAAVAVKEVKKAYAIPAGIDHRYRSSGLADDTASR